jgi:ribosomal protein S27AE
MPDYSDELDDIVAAASICPDCETMAFAYRSTDPKTGESNRWEFPCPRCGTDFAMPESESVL